MYSGSLFLLNREKGFNPDLILMGPGLTNEGKVPETLEVPKGYGVKVFPGDLPESPVYEAFTPSAFYSLASPDLKAPEKRDILRCS